MLQGYYQAYVSYWNKKDIMSLYQEQMQTAAFICRYGHVSLRDVLATDSAWLRDFCNALNTIVNEENAVSDG